MSAPRISDSKQNDSVGLVLMTGGYLLALFLGILILRALAPISIQ